VAGGAGNGKAIQTHREDAVDDSEGEIQKRILMKLVEENGSWKF
jgi:hypothetical protein